MTYDILYSPYEEGDSETFLDWAIWEGNLSLTKALTILADAIEYDIHRGHEADYAYRIVQHGKWGV